MADVRLNKIGETHLIVGEVITENGDRVSIKQKFARLTTSGDQNFIAAVTSKKIRIVSYRIQAQGTVDVYFLDTTPTQLSQVWSFQAREGCVVSAPAGGFLFEGAAGLAVKMNLSASVNVDVSATYIEV